MIATYKDLDVFKGGYKLSLDIYKETVNYPKHEIYGIISQIRRATVSIPLNIAEGYGRRSDIEFKRFLKISLGSLYEVQTLLDLSLDLKYIKQDKCNELKEQYDILGKKLYKLIEVWK